MGENVLLRSCFQLYPGLPLGAGRVGIRRPVPHRIRVQRDWQEHTQWPGMPCSQSVWYATITGSIVMWSESSQESVQGRVSPLWDLGRQKSIKILSASIDIFQLSLARPYSLLLKSSITKTLGYSLSVYLRVEGKMLEKRRKRIHRAYMYFLRSGVYLFVYYLWCLLILRSGVCLLVY